MQEQIMNIVRHGTGEVDAEVPDAASIRTLNDSFRRSFVGGQVTLTAGIGGLPDRVRAEVISAVRNYSCFDADNDPYDEHDFGVVDIDQTRAFWKIDYYDRSLRIHSPDPADPAVTTRILTIMLAEEN